MSEKITISVTMIDDISIEVVNSDTLKIGVGTKERTGLYPRYEKSIMITKEEIFNSNFNSLGIRLRNTIKPVNDKLWALRMSDY